MVDEYTPILKLLEALSKLGLKFKVEEGDAVYIEGLESGQIALIDAILNAEPDEHGDTEKGYRLWWD